MSGSFETNIVPPCSYKVNPNISKQYPKWLMLMMFSPQTSFSPLSVGGADSHQVFSERPERGATSGYSNQDGGAKDFPGA